MIMKVLLYMIIFPAIMLTATPGFLQGQEVSDMANQAIRNGDAGKLSDYFNSSIDIILPDIDQSMSKSHATQVMKDFFRDNPPRSFTVNHTGSSREATKYTIGTYKSGTKSFKTYMLLKEIDVNYLIVQLQFEQE